MILFVLLSASLISCAQVSVPNVKFCVNKGEAGVECDYTNGGPSERHSASEWQSMSVGIAATDMASLTALLGTIRKLCFNSNRCTFEQYKEIEKTSSILYESPDDDCSMWNNCPMAYACRAKLQFHP
jgi:hypothetical protein